MATLIFDIETVGEEWEALDETTQGVLTRWIERSAQSEEERTAKLHDLKEGLGFSPLTGFIVAIGLFDLERAGGVVYYSAPETDTEQSYGAYVLKPRSESEMLADFWEGARTYDTFVTFNGRGFDVPFMNIRSAVHGIRPSKDLMEGRYLYQQKRMTHVDLQDQLTYYGAMGKRPSLHLFCRAFGIESPKGEVSGDDVAGLFDAHEFQKIAEYNVRDVEATTALYEVWRKTLAPPALRTPVDK